MTIHLEPKPADIQQSPIQLEAPESGRGIETRFYLAMVGLLVVAAVALALLLTRGGTDAPEVSSLEQAEVVDVLLRSGPRTADIELEYLYTPSWYYEWSGRDLPVGSGEPSLVFFLFETVHEGELPAALPASELVIGDSRFEPTGSEAITEAPHHRVTQITFPAAGPSGALLTEGASSMSVFTTDGAGADVEMSWDLPLPYGTGVINGDTATTPFGTTALSMGAILAIFGGMLTALSPCLLLLATYYSAVLGGAAVAGTSRRAATAKLMTTGLFFVAGFTAIYTAGGVFAGYVGQSLTRLDGIGQYARPASVVAGIAVVLLGIRVASQARVPVVCKIPGFNRPSRSGWLGSALMGSTFAVGCLSCFSATVLSALLLYAGATGSPVTGGLIMFVFAAGVGVIFMAAAWLVAQAAPLMTWLEKARPYIGAASAALMIFFGVLMITYQFHIVTGRLFRLWS